jgi:hypothetical protein
MAGPGGPVADNADSVARLAEARVLGHREYPAHAAEALLGIDQVGHRDDVGGRLAAGAEFIVMICGDVMTMPGLPKVPSAEKIDLDEQGKVTGLF